MIAILKARKAVIIPGFYLIADWIIKTNLETLRKAHPQQNWPALYRRNSVKTYKEADGKESTQLTIRSRRITISVGGVHSVFI